MNHTYVYRKHLRAGFQYLILAMSIVFSFILILSLGFILTDGHEIKKGYLVIWVVVLLIFFLMLALEIGVIYLVVIKRFKSISVCLTEDVIVYTNAKTQTIIPYEEIEKLEFPSIKYAGGWVKIVHRGGNIRLTVVLENIGDFICELKERLKKREMTQVYNEKKLFSFLKTAVFSDESWDRLYCNVKLHLAAYYSCIILTITLLMLNGNTSYNKFLIFGSVLAPLVGYFIGEIIIGFQVKKRVKKEELNILPRNREFEQKVISITDIGATLVYLLILLMIVII